MGAQGPDPLISGLTTYSGQLKVIHGSNGQSLMVIAETGLIFGNAVNNPPVTFAGSGALSAAAFVPTGSTVPATGMYAPSITTFGFAIGGNPTVTVSATGNWSFNAPTGIGANAVFNAFPGTVSPPVPASQAVTIAGIAGVTNFVGTSPLGLRITGTAGASDYEGIDFGNAGGGIPVARIAVSVAGTGSVMSFGTSNIFASGITNTALTIANNGIVSALNTGDSTQYQVGFKATPQNSQSGNYTVAATDAGGQIYYVGAGGVTLTISSSTPAFPVGTCVRILNDSAGQVNVAFGGQLLWSPNNTLGTPRHIAAGSSAVIEKVVFGGTERWWITGNGLS